MGVWCSICDCGIAMSITSQPPVSHVPGAILADFPLHACCGCWGRGSVCPSISERAGTVRSKRWRCPETVIGDGEDEKGSGCARHDVKREVERV